jgi:hypothetical protein
MKLEDAWAIHDAHTGKASDVARNLALAALALVWVFRTSTGSLPRILLWPCALVLVALGCDLAHYFIAGIRWYLFVREKEREGKSLDEEVGGAPAEINDPSLVLYYTKIPAVVVAYVVLLCYALGRLFTDM